MYKRQLQLAVDGRLAVHLLKGQESFKTAPLLAANAWVVLPEAAELIPAGSPVSVYPLRPGTSSIAREYSP